MQGAKLNNGETYRYHSPSSDRVLNREISSPLYSSGDSSGSGSAGFIEHSVSKMDTLAGVAIKYGVEVGDIKMINGLTTDLQMFALKSLKIPTPGRHPPSPCFYDSSPETSREERPSKYSNLMDSLEWMRAVGAPPPTPLLQKPKQLQVSPAMTTLQCYYGLRSCDGFEMAVYSHDGEGKPLPSHRRSRSVSNGFPDEGINSGGGGGGDDDVFSATSTTTELVRRRQRCDAAAEVGLSTSAKGRGRPTPAGETTGTSLLGDLQTESSSTERGVRKSSSMSSLQGGAAEASPSTRTGGQRCGLKPSDLRPVCEVPRLPKPTVAATGRRHKAALD